MWDQSQRLLTQLAPKIFEEQPDILLYLNRSTLASIQSDYANALTFAQTSYALASELKRESTIGEAAVEQGKLHMFLGDLAEADRWLQIGRAIWQKEEIAHQLAMAHAYLAKLNCLQNELVQCPQLL